MNLRERLQASVNFFSLLNLGYLIYLLFGSISHDGNILIHFNIFNEIWVDLAILIFVSGLLIYLIIEGVKNSKKD